ncbi:hypothetical protein JW968_00305 [Candidatus Woesearchaeota archaeon]|nr:hypothetical protein [Candidatus Woesearchaeota archaeon]
MSQEIKYPAPEDIAKLHDDILNVTGGKSGTLIDDYPSTMLHSLYYQDHSDLCNGAAFIL